MFPSENVERQVTIGVVIPMEKLPFLVAVQRVVGGVNIKDNLGWDFGMGFKENIEPLTKV